MKFHNKGDYIKSIPLLEMAVAIDPEFAMAYRSLAVAYGNLGYISEAKKRFQKAFELSDRVSDRERYQIQGTFYWQSEKTWDKAIEAYNKLLKLYPEDSMGNVNLAYLYAGLEEWDKARERLERLIKSKDETYYPYYTLADVYMAKGLYDKAKEILEYYLNNISDNVYLWCILADAYLCQGKYKPAIKAAQKAFSLDPTHYRNFLTRGDISLFRGDLDDSEKEFQKLLDKEEPLAHDYGLRRLGALYLVQGKFKVAIDQAEQGVELAEMLGETSWKSWFHLNMAYLYLKSGNLEQALKECEKGWSSAVDGENLNWQRRALHYKGLIFLEMKSIEQAQRTADELSELIEKGMHGKSVRLYHHLMGKIELEKKRFSEAVEYFENALSLLPSQHPEEMRSEHVLFIDSLASAHFQRGELDKAREEYEKIMTLTVGRLYYGDLYARSFYMLGKIYQEKGLGKKARENYQRFLDLWNNADPGIREIADAKEQLDAIKVK